jgi:hypothetical protein
LSLIYNRIEGMNVKSIRNSGIYGFGNIMNLQLLFVIIEASFPALFFTFMPALEGRHHGHSKTGITSSFLNQNTPNEPEQDI